MSQTHLTDTQLQDYLDGNLAPDNPLVVHLESCPTCQAALADYKALCISLAEEPDIFLSIDFADAVMDRIENPEPAVSPAIPWYLRVRESVWAAAAVIILLGIGFYFIDGAELFRGVFGQIHLPVAEANNPFFTTIKNMLGARDNTVMMVIFTTITIGVIGVVDRIISHARDKKEHISYLVM